MVLSDFSRQISMLAKVIKEDKIVEANRNIQLLNSDLDYVLKVTHRPLFDNLVSICCIVCGAVEMFRQRV